jgi:multicomponent Na+:H+ antiporter subunit D
MIVGALFVPLLRGRLQSVYLLALPILSFLHLLGYYGLPEGSYCQFQILDYTLTLARVDKLSLIFGVIFHITAFLCVIYSLHVRDNLQHVTGMIYAGAGIAAVFAGDLITLFVYWELTGISSVFLVWASRNERAYK